MKGSPCFSGLLLLCCLVLGWPAGASAAEALRLSMFPSYGPEEIQSRLAPLAAMLSSKLGVEVEPHIVTDFNVYEKKLETDGIDISYANPYVYVKYAKQQEALGLMSKGGENGHLFRGVIITRSDSPLKDLSELRDKKLSIMGRSSSYGYLSQKLSLLEAGVDPEREMKLEVAVDNKLENVIFSVYLKEADAGCISGIGLHQVDKFVPPAMVKVLATTAPLPGWVLSVRRTLPNGLRDKVQQAILALPAEDPVLKSMQISAFRRPGAQDFDGLRRVMGMQAAEKEQ
ncbi:MAG: hypothetical protein BWK76_09870 [Desulfobulbaceae bacterium A2]|nr:MAG: hypothetical protein BWK76_09870 [Desulfobulbaceae bacterium A2]